MKLKERHLKLNRAWEVTKIGTLRPRWVKWEKSGSGTALEKPPSLVPWKQQRPGSAVPPVLRLLGLISTN